MAIVFIDQAIVDADSSVASAIIVVVTISTSSAIIGRIFEENILVNFLTVLRDVVD